MIIEKIDVKSFGLLKDTVLEFSESVNVIEGENESGKSTIAAFIKYMLFGFDSPEGEAGISERTRRINWDTGIAQGSMTVRVRGKRYHISRSTVAVKEANGRITYKEDSSIIDMESGATAFGKVPAGEVFFGVNRDLFENTAFIGQIGDSSINEGSVKESIENILFSGSEKLNNMRAMGRINDKMENLLHRGGQGGVIVDLSRKKGELEEGMARSEEDNALILEREAELYRIRSERADAESKLAGLYDLDTCYKNAMLIQTFDRLHELEEEAAAKAEAYTAFIAENTRGGFVPTEDYLSELVSSRRAVNEAYHALGEAEENYTREKNAIGITREIEGAIELADELGGEERILADSARHRGGFIKSIALSVLSALVLIAAAVYEAVATGTLALLVFRILVGVVGAVALGGGVSCLVLMLRSRKKLASLAATFGVSGYVDLKGKLSVISEARAKRDGMIRSTEDARLALEAARTDYDNKRSALTHVVLRWGEEPPVSGLSEFLDALENKVKIFLEKKRILLDDKNAMEMTVREIRRTLADKNEIDIRATVPPLKRRALANIHVDEIVGGIANYKAKIVELDRKAQVIENELIGLRTCSGDPGDYYTKIVALDERIEELKQKHKAYFIAMKAIESASDNLRAGISPRLGEYSTDLMGIMTDKKYTGFNVDNGLKVTYSADDGTQRSVDFLSGGTRDLTYVAVRMALVDMLYTEAPPIVFDESFAHQDNIRARSMMKSLAHLAKEGYQSFVFTCRGREGALALELAEGAEVFKLTAVE